ncbi:MAG: RDD family protein [Verrucomicrobia bacterium]|nr:RDD family protein [Verrucomicrobiota bacterium]
MKTHPWFPLKLLWLPLVCCSLLHGLAQDGPPRRDRSHHFNRGEIVVFGQDVVLEEGETSNTIVIIGGNLIVDGTAEGDVVVLFGSVTVSGHANRDLVVVGGSAELLEGGSVDGDAVIVGGSLKRAPGSTINGDQRHFDLGGTFPNLSWVGDWTVKGLLYARPLPPQFSWVWGVAAVLAITYLLLAAVFPRPVGACVQALETNPAASIVVGLLSIALVGPVVFLLIVSVAGLFVIPVLLFALTGACLFGKLAVYQCTGKQMGLQLGVRSLQQPALALLIGIALYTILYTVPVLGFLVWGLTLAWGLGAVFIAGFTLFQNEKKSSPALVTTRAALTGQPPVPTPTPQQPAPPQLESPVPDLAETITLERAGFWIRFWASFLDLVLLGILLSFTGAFFFILWAAYHVGMWLWKGTTIGGIVAGIKVLRLDDKPLDFSVALVRSLSSFFSAAVLFLGFFWAGWDRDKQSWHDKIAGTVVVKVPKGMSLF